MKQILGRGNSKYKGPKAGERREAGGTYGRRNLCGKLRLFFFFLFVKYRKPAKVLSRGGSTAKFRF